MAEISVLLPVLHVEPWQRHMTEAAIQIMRACTALPYRLVVVEAGSADFKDHPDVTEHVHFPERVGYVAELNAGLERCGGDFAVITGNDIFMRPGWLEALLEPFGRFRDCGLSTLASSDLKLQRRDAIEEGIWGPLMCFPTRYRWRFDPDFKRLFIDTDLIMRIYEEGFRSYRNWRVVVTHLNQGTHATLFTIEENTKLMESGLALFKQKHEKRGGHTLVYRALTQGAVV